MRRKMLGDVCNLCSVRRAEQYNLEHNLLCLTCFLRNMQRPPKFLRKYLHFLGEVCCLCGGIIHGFGSYYGLEVINGKEYFYHEHCITPAGFIFNYG